MTATNTLSPSWKSKEQKKNYLVVKHNYARWTSSFCSNKHLIESTLSSLIKEWLKGQDMRELLLSWKPTTRPLCMRACASKRGVQRCSIFVWRSPTSHSLVGRQAGGTSPKTTALHLFEAWACNHRSPVVGFPLSQSSLTPPIFFVNT